MNSDSKEKARMIVDQLFDVKITGPLHLAIRLARIPEGVLIGTRLGDRMQIIFVSRETKWGGLMLTDEVAWARTAAILLSPEVGKLHRSVAATINKIGTDIT